MMACTDAESPTESPRIFVSAFLCQEIIREKNDILTALRIVNAFTVEPTMVETPSPDGKSNTTLGFPILSFSAYCSFHADEHAEFDVRIKGIDPNGAELLPANPPVKCAVEGGALGHTLVVALKLATRVPGDYRIEIYVNENLAAKIPLRVIHNQTEVLAGHQSPAPLGASE
jgi:hypothetical protein